MGTGEGEMGGGWEKGWEKGKEGKEEDVQMVKGKASLLSNSYKGLCKKTKNNNFKRIEGD